MKNSTRNIFLTLISLCFVSAQLFAQVPANTQGEIVNFKDAESWMQNYDAQFTEEVRGHLYGQKALMQLLDQDGVQGVKIYNAQDLDGTQKLVFKGLGSEATEVGLAFDVSRSCPPVCGGGGIVIEDIGAPISFASAQLMINEFALNNPESPSSYTFSASVVKEVLTQSGSKGLFLAYGLDQVSNPQMILIGLSAEGELMKDGKVAAQPEIGFNTVLSAQK